MSVKCFMMEDTGKTKREQWADGKGYAELTIWRRVDTGEEMLRRDFPVGAMWHADWLSDIDEYRGPDGRTLCVLTPGGEWTIDSKASNCTKPDDLVHKCWVRHGIAPNITVDKNGNTCAAGAGSIMCGTYHGFLQNGELT